MFFLKKVGRDKKKRMVSREQSREKAVQRTQYAVKTYRICVFKGCTLCKQLEKHHAKGPHVNRPVVISRHHYFWSDIFWSSNHSVSRGIAFQLLGITEIKNTQESSRVDSLMLRGQL